MLEKPSTSKKLIKQLIKSKIKEELAGEIAFHLMELEEINVSREIQELLNSKDKIDKLQDIALDFEVHYLYHIKHLVRLVEQTYD